MIITSIKDSLHKGLNTANRIVTQQQAIPILKNVLIDAKPEGLFLTASNLQMTITTKVEAIIDQEGAITLPARLLQEFVNSLPSEPIRINVPAGSMVANLSCGRAEAHIHGADPAEYPEAPRLVDAESTFINAKELRTAISRTAFAAAKEDNRPILTGVTVSVQGTTISLAAADGFRMAISKLELPAPAPRDYTVVIPAQTLTQLNRTMVSDEEPVEIMVTQTAGQILFKLKDTELVSQLLKGDPPNYQQLVPTNTTTVSKFDRKAFLQAANTAAIFAKENSNIIRLDLRAKGENGEGQPTATISAQADDLGSNKDEINLQEMEGDDTKIAFNSAYLRELLNTVEPDHITMATSSPTAPGLFTLEDSDEYVHVIMPMFLP